MRKTQVEVLANLSPGQGEPKWLRPLDFGGSSNSHHGLTATRLIRQGWVERQRRAASDGSRGSYEYRITAKGMEALANHQALLALAVGRKRA